MNQSHKDKLLMLELKNAARSRISPLYKLSAVVERPLKKLNKLYADNPKFKAELEAIMKEKLSYHDLAKLRILDGNERLIADVVKLANKGLSIIKMAKKLGISTTSVSVVRTEALSRGLINNDWTQDEGDVICKVTKFSGKAKNTIIDDAKTMIKGDVLYVVWRTTSSARAR